MEFTKNKLLICIWLWSLFCIVVTLAITFGTSFQNGFFERVPNFVVFLLWTAIPMLLIMDLFVNKVFWVMATVGTPCLIISLFGAFCLIGSKNWKLIFLYLFFVFSLVPHLVVVFYMRKFLKSCEKTARRQDEERQLEENRREQERELEDERRRHEMEIEQERMKNEMEFENKADQVMRLLERQNLERMVAAGIDSKSSKLSLAASGSSGTPCTSELVAWKFSKLSSIGSSSTS
ncbi:hypothetical protein GCK72_013444 [Caenorhabditis remanei]|uniref:Uncharacterized protein n=1 Tax=Caenorhabditis remanei TaxID=31234 RepID=A0A6A5GR90_CAERE|nr:hypothetical protein GCK72_013444 [Caenorhabditis remanei]KAF1756989.1 hypothetical protein GCK72_013444 [Caenorhabditis remanei]